MLTLITFFVVALVTFLVGALIDKCSYHDGWALLSYATGVISTIAFFICLITLINKDREFDAIQEQYQVLSVMVESYDGQDYGNMTTLIDEVIYMNRCIANHKAFYTSPWIGIWYSEKIANLEPIKIGGKNPQLKE
jgi:Na+/melibiose symporter-like transporter